jgi:hypothetical protein
MEIMRQMFTWAAVALACSSAASMAQSVPSDVGISADNVTLGAQEHSPYVHRSFR